MDLVFRDRPSKKGGQTSFRRTQLYPFHSQPRRHRMRVERIMATMELKLRNVMLARQIYSGHCLVSTIIYAGE